MRMTKKRWAATLVTTAALLFGLVGGAVLWHSMPHNQQQDQPGQPTSTMAACPMWQAQGQGDRLWGYLDSMGQWAVEPQYQEALPFYQGAAVTWVRQQDQWSAIDRNGKTVVHKLRAQLEDANQDGYVVLTEKGIASLYDPKGVKVFGVEGRIGAFQGPLAPFTRNKNGGETYGLVDRKGNIIIEPVYAAIGLLDQDTPIAKTTDGAIVALDLTGEITATLPATASISGAGSGFATYQDEQGFLGYVDQQGAIAIPARFYQASSFHQGSALVKTKEGYRLIDPSGAYLTSPFPYGQDVGQGLFAFSQQQDGPFTLYNAQGPVTANDVCQWNDWENGLLGVQTAQTSYLLDASGTKLAASEIEGSYRLYRRGGLFYAENVSGFYYNDQGQVLISQAPAQPLDLAGWQATQALFAPDWYVQMTYPVFTAEGFVTAGLNAMVEEWCVEDYYEGNEPNEADLYPSTLRGTYQLSTVNTLANLIYCTNIHDNQNHFDRTIYSNLLVDLVSGERYRLEDLFHRGWKQVLRKQAQARYLAQLAPGNEPPAALAQAFTDPNWPQRNVPFELDKETVLLYLQEEQGVTIVAIPYTALADKINQQSPLWQTIAGGATGKRDTATLVPAPDQPTE